MEQYTCVKYIHNASAVVAHAIIQRRYQWTLRICSHCRVMVLSRGYRDEACMAN